MSRHMEKPPIEETKERFFKFIVGFAQGNGETPTRKEIATRFGFKSDQSVDAVLRILEGEGRITRVPNSARGIRITGGVTQ